MGYKGKLLKSTVNNHNVFWNFAIIIVWFGLFARKDLQALAMIPYFKFHFFPHLVIFLQLGDPSYVLNLSTKVVLQRWHILCKRAKYLQFELIFRQA